MRLHHESNPFTWPAKPANWSRALLVISIAAICTTSQTVAQTYFNLAGGNYSESFTSIMAWGGLGTTGNVDSNSFSGLAASTGTVPTATVTTAQTTTFAANASSGGVHRVAGNIQLLSTGTTNNTSSAAVDLNLNFAGRATGNLSFNAAQVGNGTGDRQGTLRVYYSTNGTTWAEITGGNLPFIATNNVASGASINVPVPAAANGQSQVKVRFYFHNGPAGTTGSRPKISIDDVLVTSVSDGSPDTTPPAITTFSPANGASGVLGSANLVATFNEIVAAGTGNIVITKTTGDLAVLTIPVGDPQVSISGSTVTVNPTVDLALGTGYAMTIDPGAIRDAAGNNFPGIPNSSTWAFTTIPPDNTSPTVVSFAPAAGATDVAPVSSLSITFSEPVNSVGGKFIVLKSGATVIETREATVFDGVFTSGNVATINLTNPLQYGVSYHVQIESGAFEDNSSNTYAGIPNDDTTTWSFSTVNVPSLTGTPYTQTFSTYTSAATLPQGWSYSGAPNLDATYRGTWGTVTPDPGNPAATLGGFLGNAGVFGYHHTSLSNTTVQGLIQTLTLRNTTGATIETLSVAYQGRVNVTANTRIPAFTVAVAGTPVPALGYSTADGDNAQRNATVTGLAIADGATFQIQWSSAYPTGAGSARQIGISDVSVSAANTLYAPTVAALSVPVGTIGSLAAPAQADVIGDGGQTVTGRGFVYSATATNPAPQLGGIGVTAIADGAPGAGPFSATLTGLTPATSYTVSAYATNTTGTSYTALATFTSLATPPTFSGNYTQAFNNYNGTNPAGWTAISDAIPPLQTYAGTWGQQASAGGFLGGATPGVLGYRHTGSSGTLTVTLRLINGTAATLNTLDVSYLGRVNDTEEGRNPIWAVSVNGSAPIEMLAYDTGGNIDATRAATVSGLSIAPGEEFSISWKSSRGAGAGSSKQIGIGAVVISAAAAPYSFGTWASANSAAGGPNGDHDNDGVKNSLEYFMRATGSTFTANPSIVGGKITWPKEPGFVGTYTVQTSPDLVNWTNVSSNVVGNTVEYTPTAPGFVRLQVVVTP